MKLLMFVLTVLVAFLGYRVVALEQGMRQIQTNAAIAVLSAEAANNKVGAIAPFFAQDKEAFAKAWLDNNNLPQAVFSDEILIPIRRRLEERRVSPEAQAMKASIFR